MKIRSVLASALLVAGSASFAYAASSTDHATFDSTNPANLESGTYCEVSQKNKLNATPQGWRMNVTISNIGGAVQTVRIRDFGDGFVQYPIPANSSVNLTYAGGNNVSSGAFRVDATGATTLSGYVSAEAIRYGNQTHTVFCTSCDTDDSGAAFCDARIPN